MRLASLCAAVLGLTSLVLVPPAGAATPTYVIGQGGTSVSVSVTTVCGILTFYAHNLKTGTYAVKFHMQGVTGTRDVQTVAVHFTITPNSGSSATYTRFIRAPSLTHNLTGGVVTIHWNTGHRPTKWHAHTGYGEVTDSTGLSCLTVRLTSFTIT